MAVEGAVEVVHLAGDFFGVGRGIGIGMGRADDIGGAALAGHAQHGERYFAAGRAVVHSPEDVTVDIDQLSRYTLAAGWGGRGRTG